VNFIVPILHKKSFFVFHTTIIGLGARRIQKILGGVPLEKMLWNMVAFLTLCSASKTSSLGLKQKRLEMQGLLSNWVSSNCNFVKEEIILLVVPIRLLIIKVQKKNKRTKNNEANLHKMTD